MIFKVDGWNNFCRVFELPVKFSSEFCFHGGVPTNFQMVDWFNPVCDDRLCTPACTKEVWLEEVGKIVEITVTLEHLTETLVPFLKKKKFIKKDRRYIVICDFGAVLLFDGETSDE